MEKRYERKKRCRRYSGNPGDGKVTRGGILRNVGEKR